MLLLLLLFESLGILGKGWLMRAVTGGMEMELDLRRLVRIFFWILGTGRAWSCLPVQALPLLLVVLLLELSNSLCERSHSRVTPSCKNLLKKFSSGVVIFL